MKDPIRSQLACGIFAPMAVVFISRLFGLNPDHRILIQKPEQRFATRQILQFDIWSAPLNTVCELLQQFLGFAAHHENRVDLAQSDGRDMFRMNRDQHQLTELLGDLRRNGSPFVRKHMMCFVDHKPVRPARLQSQVCEFRSRKWQSSPAGPRP